MTDVRENNIVSDEKPVEHERSEMEQDGQIVCAKHYNESEPGGHSNSEDNEENGADKPNQTSETENCNESERGGHSNSEDSEENGADKPNQTLETENCNESERGGHSNSEDSEEKGADKPNQTSKTGNEDEMKSMEVSGDECAHDSLDNWKEKNCDVSMEALFLGGYNKTAEKSDDMLENESIRTPENLTEPISDNEANITSSETQMSTQESNELTNGHLCYESRAMQESLTITNCNHIPFTDICKIKSYHQVPYRFRCRARVLHYDPMKVVNMVRIGCHKCEIFRDIENLNSVLKDGVSLGILQCPNCEERLDFDFVVSFLLEDDTGIINVLLCGEEALHFFSAFEMQKVIWDTDTKNDIEEKLEKLTLGKRDSLRALGADISARPHFECIIQSYFTTNPCLADDDRPFVCYQICDTVLVV